MKSKCLKLEKNLKENRTGNCELTVLETQVTLGTYDTGRRKKKTTNKNKNKKQTNKQTNKQKQSELQMFAKG